jgi:hypothetical protein
MQKDCHISIGRVEGEHEHSLQILKGVLSSLEVTFMKKWRVSVCCIKDQPYEQLQGRTMTEKAMLQEENTSREDILELIEIHKKNESLIETLYHCKVKVKWKRVIRLYKEIYLNGVSS